jgi:hypothetical protein
VVAVTTIFVGYFPQTTTEDELRRLFVPYGTVARVQIRASTLTMSRSLRYGYVEMPNEREACVAIGGLHGTTWGESTLRVYRLDPLPPGRRAHAEAEPVERAVYQKKPVSGIWLPDPTIASATTIEGSPAGSPHPVRLEFDIPWDRSLFVITLTDPLGWNGYTYALLGTDPPLQLPSRATIFRLGNLVGPHLPPVLVAYERRITHTETPIALVWRWHPLQGTSLALTGLELDTRKGSLHLMYDGIALLNALEDLGGRPPNFEDKATFRRKYWDAYHKVLEEKQRDGNRLPSKTEVAAEMLIDRKTLYRYRVRHHLTWPPPPPP